MTPEKKALENRLRRQAKRQGVLLRKSRARDAANDEWGGYMLVDDNNALRAGEKYSLGLDDVQKWLDEDEAARHTTP